ALHRLLDALADSAARLGGGQRDRRAAPDALLHADRRDAGDQPTRLVAGVLLAAEEDQRPIERAVVQRDLRDLADRLAVEFVVVDRRAVLGVVLVARRDAGHGVL